MNTNQNQVPDQRFQELQEQYRKAMDTVNQLKGTIDAVMAQRNAPPPQAPPQVKHNLKPEVAEDVQKIAQHVAQSLVAQQTEAFRGAYNGLWERNDMNEFRLLHGPETYDKFKDKIESLRQERAKAGQFMTRDEAYKFVYYEENAKKPKPTPVAPQENKPTFDPYLNQWSQPTPPAQAASVDQNPPQVTPPERTNPTVTLDGVQDVLPPQGQMKSNVATPPAQQSGFTTFNQDSGAIQSPDQIKAFESKFGDIPL